MHQNPRLCKYPHKHSDLGLKKVNGRKRKRICNSNFAILDPDCIGSIVLDPDFGLPVALLSSDACELAPLKIVLLCVFSVFFLFLLLSLHV